MPWTPSPPAARGTRRVVLLATVLVAATAGYAVGALASPAAIDQAGPELVQLMRFMAALKALLALAAAAAVFGRLGGPVGGVRFAAYTVATAAMVAGPGLIWGMTHVVAGSIMLHAGLLGTVLLLWRDAGAAAWLEGLMQHGGCKQHSILGLVSVKQGTSLTVQAGLMGDSRLALFRFGAPGPGAPHRRELYR
jgi:hypothetical protein